MTPKDKALVQHMIAELDGLAPMAIMLQPDTVFQFVAMMQMILRHPTLPPDATRTAQTFIVGAREYFATCPALTEAIRRGDVPSATAYYGPISGSRN